MKVVPFPSDCADCSDPDKREWGCGFAGYAGQKTDEPFRYAGAIEPYSRTCPRYYRCFPWVQQILSDLQDYERGALGNPLLLEAPYLELLRVASAERQSWEAKSQTILAEKHDG